ncbi:MAG: FecR domain-containing protein, partial [Pseudomonadota bacterium]
MMTSKRLSLAALMLATTALATAQAETNIGTVSALNRNVDGTPPQAETRTLVIGDGLFSDELIESSPIGSGQFLFLDQTTLTIAKNSTIVLDKYVYNPETRTGEFAMSMQRGVLRFVGGRITKNADAVITTPTATIGIRGGMAIIIVDEDGTTRVMHIAGEYTRVTRIGDDPSLTGGGGSGSEIVITRGNGLAEVPPGGEVTFIGVADQRLVRETTLALIGRGDAGEKVEPQDPDVVVSGVPSENSEAKGAEKEPPISTRGERSNSGVRDEEDENRFFPKEEEVTGPLAELRQPEPQAPPPPPPPPPNALLDGVTGSASFSGATTPGVTTGPGGQNFIFTQVLAGSRIGITADDEVFIIPTEAGFFTFGFDEGASPAGAIAGGGFFSAAPEFTYAVFQTRDGDTGAFLAGRANDPLRAAPNGSRRARSYELSPDLFTGNGAAFTPASQSGFSAAGQSELTLLSNSGG